MTTTESPWRIMAHHHPIQQSCRQPWAKAWLFSLTPRKHKVVNNAGFWIMYRIFPEMCGLHWLFTRLAICKSLRSRMGIRPSDIMPSPVVSTQALFPWLTEQNVIVHCSCPQVTDILLHVLFPRTSSVRSKPRTSIKVYIGPWSELGLYSKTWVRVTCLTYFSQFNLIKTYSFRYWYA